MPITPSGGYMNVAQAQAVIATVTYTATNVTGLDYDDGISTKKLSGDAARYPTVSVNDFYDPTVTITAGNIKPLLSAPGGVEGVWTFIINDAVNADLALSGGLTITMNQGKIEERKVTAKHREYAEGTVKIGCRSTDGVTNPVAVAFA